MTQSVRSHVAGAAQAVGELARGHHVGRVKADLEEYGTVEQEPKMEGRLMVMVLAPKKK